MLMEWAGITKDKQTHFLKTFLIKKASPKPLLCREVISQATDTITTSSQDLHLETRPSCEPSSLPLLVAAFAGSCAGCWGGRTQGCSAWLHPSHGTRPPCTTAINSFRFSQGFPFYKHNSSVHQATVQE